MEEVMDFQTGDSDLASLEFLLASRDETMIGRTTQDMPDNAYRIPEPQPPLQEDYSQLVIEDCKTQQEVPVINHDGLRTTMVVDVVKSQNPSQAYLRIPSKLPKNLDNHGPGWGCVYFGIILQGLGNNLFQAPSYDAVEYVAIKKLRLSVVSRYLKMGGKENPYKEILRMQTIGDNVHVLGCHEALQDETHLYIVMPYCEHESLVECINWSWRGNPTGMGLDEPQAMEYFRQILENILYLRSYGICHRDLSPDNCMIYKGRVVFTDLAMSFRMPHSVGIDAVNIVTPLGGFGKQAYLPPDVCFNLPFDANLCDLWACAVILFNLLTGEILYKLPHPSDLLFRYFLLGKGLSQNPVNERTTEVLMEVKGGDKTSLWNVTQKVLALNDSVLSLLEAMLRVQSSERARLKTVQERPSVCIDNTILFS